MFRKQAPPPQQTLWIATHELSATPDRSSFTVIRQRLVPEVYEAVLALMLQALKRQQLLKGQRLAIDASVLEANAAMRRFDEQRPARRTRHVAWQNPRW